MAILALSAAVFAGFFIQGVTGFGAILVVMSVAMLFADRAMMVQLCMLYTMLQAIVIVHNCRKEVNHRHLYISLGVAALAGAPLGCYIVGHIDEASARGVFTVSLFIYSTLSLKKILKSVDKEENLQKRSVWVNGMLLIASGCFQFMYGIGGPALVAYLSRVTPEKNVMRATMCAYWLILNGMILLYEAIAGGWALDMHYTLLLAPGFLLGGWLGERVAWRINQRRFMIFVFTSLIVSSILIFIQTFISLV